MAGEILNDPEMLRLARLCGLSLVTIYGLQSAIGDIQRFAQSNKLVAYLGLNPSVCQSGNYEGGGAQTLRRPLACPPGPCHWRPRTAPSPPDQAGQTRHRPRPARDQGPRLSQQDRLPGTKTLPPPELPLKKEETIGEPRFPKPLR